MIGRSGQFKVGSLNGVSDESVLLEEYLALGYLAFEWNRRRRELGWNLVSDNDSLTRERPSDTEWRRENVRQSVHLTMTMTAPLFPIRLITASFPAEPWYNLRILQTLARYLLINISYFVQYQTLYKT